ncbi:DUF689-domain-containing protein [Ramicandelaber brevisporus]|nr:DUF689-domain-containing protein [Ramicandelaber brevisporus]
MTYESLNIKAGDEVLLVAHTGVSPDDMLAARNSLLTDLNASQVGFEQLDRLPEAPVPASKYAAVASGTLRPVAFPHSSAALSKIVRTLQPGGRLELAEPVLIDAKSDAANALPITRTASDSSAELVLAGFVDVRELERSKLKVDELRKIAQDCWQLPGLDADKLVDSIEIVRFSARKPEYEVGAAVALSFGKKKKLQKPVEPAPAPVPAPSSVPSWVLNTVDDDITNGSSLIDEDDLLDDDILAKPSAASLARPDNCKTKKRACKNCSCGRAEMEAAEDAAALAANHDDIALATARQTVFKPTLPKSSCGSCYLGDAFRCSTCPYLGMPAFKPGEQIQLVGQFGSDDI